MPVLNAKVALLGAGFPGRLGFASTRESLNQLVGTAGGVQGMHPSKAMVNSAAGGAANTVRDF